MATSSQLKNNGGQELRGSCEPESICEKTMCSVNPGLVLFGLESVRWLLDCPVSSSLCPLGQPKKSAKPLSRAENTLSLATG
jgi:hypothetical protein